MVLDGAYEMALVLFGLSWQFLTSIVHQILVEHTQHPIDPLFFYVCQLMLVIQHSLGNRYICTSYHIEPLH